MITEAMILAAGKGERLGKLCRRTPKVLLPVAGQTILERNIRYLKAQGIRKVIINVHHERQEILKFLRREKFGISIYTIEEEQLLGTAGGFKNARKHFNRKPVAVLYGDNLLDFDLRAMVRYHVKRRAFLTLGGYRPAETLNSGIFAGRVSADSEGWIQKMTETRSGRRFTSGEWINAGILIASPGVFACIPPKRNYDFSKQLIPALIREKKRLQVFSGASYVLASDTAQSYAKTRRIFKHYQLNRT